MGDTGDRAGAGDRLAPIAAMAVVDPLVMLPLWSSLFISISPRFSGMAFSSTSTCTSLPSFHVGMAGNESSFTTALVESKVANCGLSGGAVVLMVGIGAERYC